MNGFSVLQLAPILIFFLAPKIVRSVYGIPLAEACKKTRYAGALEVYKRRQELIGTGLWPSNTVCKKIAYPIIAQHPFIFAYYWIKEVIKTTFDLYGYQLVAMATNEYLWDPLEEFLPTKIAACLWTAPVPLATRLVCWIELFFNLFIWLGIIGGAFIFVLKPLVQRPWNQKQTNNFWVWLTGAFLFCWVVGMTGGFGYARLRLPVEPLLIIVSLYFWFRYLIQKEPPK